VDVVEVHDRAAGAAQRLVGALDQLLPALCQHLDRHIVGDQVLLDELPDEVEVGLAGRWEPDLDLLVSHADESVEHAPLALRRHRVDERLVAVAQIDRAPARSLRDDGGWPSAVGQVYAVRLFVRAVAPKRHPAGVLAGYRAGVNGRGRGGHDGSSGTDRSGIPEKLGILTAEFNRWAELVFRSGRTGCALNTATRCRPSEGLVAAEKEERLPHGSLRVRRTAK
jgi:hypothetical protein